MIFDAMLERYDQNEKSDKSRSGQCSGIFPPSDVDANPKPKIDKFGTIFICYWNVP